MSNLENLVSKITEDSRLKAQALLDDANATAAAVIKTKTDAANAQRTQILNSAKIEAARNKEQIIAGKQLAVRDKKLLAKQMLIEKVLDMALEKLKRLSEVEYLMFLERYLFSLSVAGDETLIVPPRYQGVDLTPINAKLAANGKKGGLSVQKDGRNIDGGFILIKDGIENNNTFESLMDYYHEELEIMILENLC